MGVVYRVYELSTGKSYIGQTRMNFLRRIYHLEHSIGGGGKLLMNDMRMKGADSFGAEILFESESQHELDLTESNMMVLFHSLYPEGYNLQTGGKTNFNHNMYTRKSMKKLWDKGHEHMKKSVVDDITGIVYTSINEAARTTHIPLASISRSCNENRGILLISGLFISFSFQEE